MTEKEIIRELKEIQDPKLLKPRMYNFGEVREMVFYQNELHQNILHIILEIIWKEHNKAIKEKVDSNGYAHSYAIVKEFLTNEKNEKETNSN